VNGREWARRVRFENHSANRRNALPDKTPAAGIFDPACNRFTFQALIAADFTGEFSIDFAKFPL